jgi:anti-sigma regulatory factor (Ser/Thr protein kinase)
MTEFSEQWAFRFQSIVDELCNNAIEHGSEPGKDVTLIFVSNPHDSIEIYVRDTGTGKNKMAAADLTKLIDQRRDPNYIHNGIRGRGLSKIVAEWTDELEFKDIPTGGIEVKIKKYLNDPKLKEMSQYLESPTHLVLN